MRNPDDSAQPALFSGVKLLRLSLAVDLVGQPGTCVAAYPGSSRENRSQNADASYLMSPNGVADGGSGIFLPHVGLEYSRLAMVNYGLDYRLSSSYFFTPSVFSLE